jgi:tetratricopeptide (TPR) repeat protein
MTRTPIISLLAHIALLASGSAVLDDGYLFGNGWLLLALACLVAVLSVLPLAARELFFMARQLGSVGKAPLWALPLAQMGGSVALLLVGLWIPSLFGAPDFWRDRLEISPGPMTDLVLLASLTLLGSSVLSFALLCYEWVRGRMVLTMPLRDTTTRLALRVAAGSLALLTAAVTLFSNENVEYVRAWTDYSWKRDAGGALERFRRLASRPGSRLADNSLFRIALISRDLGQGGEAREAIRELLERFPESPLADDATFWFGRLELSDGNRTAAREQFERVARVWAGSYLADDALVLLLGLARERGDADEEQRLKTLLAEGHARGYVEQERPGGKPRYVSVRESLKSTR